ncbi:MAG: chain length-determining protein [Burkholderiaceae bacterium]|nr:chain length-determining protein [Burkholderiaceae bacterium]
MEELIRQVFSIARGMWRYRWVALLVAWVVGVVGAVMAFRVPDRYEASARIFVDTQSILRPLMAGLAVQPNVNEQVGMLSRTLISRPNIEKLVRMADLDLKSGTKAQQDALVESLMRTVQIRSAGRDNLYTMHFSDTDKDKAKRVVQSMVSIFVESSLGATRKDTDAAKVFLDEQIKTYEKKLEEAEARRKDFRIRNLETQTEDGRDAASRLSQIHQQLETARLELREAENSREAAKRQLEAEKAGAAAALPNLLEQPSGTNSANADPVFPTPEIDARIEAQKRNLDGLLQRYTDQHPDVVNTRRLIRDLEESRKREVAERRQLAIANRGKVTATNPNAPVYDRASLAVQELSRVMATAEVQVAALQARVAEYQNRYSQARAGIKVAPQIEAEASQLNRDYTIIKKNYEDLVARRQAATLSGELDMASGVADFRLIDPPRVSPKPVSPNRMLLLAMALGAAIAAALAVAFGMSQIRPVFNDAFELRNRSGLPLLGVVSMVATDEERRAIRRGNLRFVAGAGGFFASFLVAMVSVSVLSARIAG